MYKKFTNEFGIEMVYKVERSKTHLMAKQNETVSSKTSC